MRTVTNASRGLRLLPALVLIIALAAGIFPAPTRTFAAAGDLFFSEYIEGSSFNKALEIYNGTGATVDLSAYMVELYSNGAAAPSQSVALSGSLASGDVYVMAHTSADPVILAAADLTNGAVVNFNGDDAVALRKGGQAVDVIGQIGVDPGTEWGGVTADNTIRRMGTVCAGDTDGSDAFDPAAEWESFAQNTFDGLGAHTASCTNAAPAISEQPADQTILAGTSATVSIVATGAPAPSYQWYQGLSGDTSTPVGADAASYTTPALKKTTSYWVRVSNSLGSVDSATATITAGGPPAVCFEPASLISAVQGSGPAAAITGPVTVQGVVVGDYEGTSPALRGFYVQEEKKDQDKDRATSEGIFVFNGNNDTVNLGDVVRVSGSAGEFQGQTQISGSVTITLCGLSAKAEPAEVKLPVPSADYLERYEGMLVEFKQDLFVTEHFQLGRFGQVVMSAKSRLSQPTNVVAPGAEALELQAANDLNKIIVDDGLNSQNPDPILFGGRGDPLSALNTLRGGDRVTKLVGVMTYTWAGNSASGNAYRVRPVGALGGDVPSFKPSNRRPSDPPRVGGTLTVASFNVLNYFLTLDNNQPLCGPDGNKQECRGAETALEFERQRAKLLAALQQLDADVVGLIELENTTGVEPLADIVAGLNAAMGAGTYSYIATGTIGGDAIKVGIIYKTATVRPLGDFAILTSAVDPRFIDTLNRPTLAQSFEEIARGGRFTVAVNHLKSKGSACDAVGDPDAGDGQGNCNLTRAAAAEAMVDWLDSDPTGYGAGNYLIIGDLNSYAMEDPISVIEAAGYTNLVRKFGGKHAYSYVFDGQWGYLDHALASRGLRSQVAGAADYHINSDEPSVLDYNTNFKSAGQIASLFSADAFRTSDHDPVLIGLRLKAPRR